jgi:hypothetical protein
MMDGRCLSDLELDVLLAVEFPAAGGEQRSAHVGTCPRCAARLRELERGRTAFEAMGFGFKGPAAGGVRARPRRWRWAGWLGATGALAAAVVGVVVAGVGAMDWRWGHAAPSAASARSATDRGGEVAPAGEVRLKGGPQLQLFIRHEGRLREAAERDRVYAEDQLQFVYSSAHSGYVAVLSRDGAGVVSVYVPSDPRRVTSVPAGSHQAFPESTILDGTLGREQVFALFCDRAVELAPLVRTLFERATLEAPMGCSMRRIELDKQERP